MPLLKRAVRSFRDQDYGQKELVVVYESGDASTAEYLSSLSDENILKIEVPATDGLTLGELRNLAVRESRGEYFCQWDDDDFSHNERLSFQMDVIRQSGLPACILVNWLIFDEENRQAYISSMRPWEGSLLCKKSQFAQESGYENKSRGEDTAFVNRLFSKSLAFPAVMPKLYIYVYHGGNVWTRQHWRGILNAGTKLSSEASKVIGDVLDGKYTGDQASRLLDQIEE